MSLSRKGTLRCNPAALGKKIKNKSGNYIRDDSWVVIALVLQSGEIRRGLRTERRLLLPA